MYRILLPVDADHDRTRRQLDAIQRLPDGDDIEVTVFHVHEPIDAPGAEIGGSIIDDINESIDELQGTPDSVTEAYETLEDAGFQTRVGAVTGDAVESILAAASDTDADLIVLAGRKRSPVGKALFGSVTQGVILESEVPVLVAN